MKQSLRAAAVSTLLVLAAATGAPDETGLNPKVVKIASEVSEDRIRTIIAKLVSFGTRNTMSSQDDPERGLPAARQWIFNELQSYSPRLQVSFDKYRVKKQGTRIFKDVDLWNVVAVLPGTKYPETQIIISGHYDSLNLGTRPATGTPAGPGSEEQPASTAGAGRGQQQTPEQLEHNANLPAPGACDDASGTAAVMELARIMSQYEFDKTLVFVSFAGEEQGLIGSTLMAAKARQENRQIEAILNNDIIGTDISGNGRTGNNSVAVFSDESLDSSNQQLSRYIRDIAHRYIPSFHISQVFMQDRLGRGGDHTPFQLEGFAAVRLSTPNEDYSHQHRDSDLLEFMSVPYTAKVARVNAVVAASLALAPKTPLITPAPNAGRGAGRGAAAETTPATPAAPPNAPTATAAGARRPNPLISRGSGYDAVIRWRPAGDESTLKGYTIVIRPTTSINWEQEIFVGKVNTYTLKDVSIDDAKFGVKAIGLDGTESLVAAYVYPPRTKTVIQTVDQ